MQYPTLEVYLKGLFSDKSETKTNFLIYWDPQPSFIWPTIYMLLPILGCLGYTSSTEPQTIFIRLAFFHGCQQINNVCLRIVPVVFFSFPTEHLSEKSSYKFCCMESMKLTFTWFDFISGPSHARLASQNLLLCFVLHLTSGDPIKDTLPLKK